MALTDKLTAIADAIRSKTGKTDALTLDRMPVEIAGIQGALPACEVKVVPLSSDVRYLNHKALVEIPAEALDEYPYAVLLVSTDGSMWLWLSTEKMYIATNEAGIDRLSIPANRVYYGFNADANAWLIQYTYTTDGGYSINGFASWAVWWSNFDIPNGSPDAEEIYFPASQIQTEQPADATHYYYNGVRLPAIPEDVPAENQHIVIIKRSNGTYRLIASPNGFCRGNPPGDGALWENDLIVNTAYLYSEDTGEWVNENNTTYYSWAFESVIWSNQNVPDGEPDAAEIYFSGSPAVPDPLQGGD